MTDEYEKLISLLRKMRDVSKGLSILMPGANGDATAKLYEDAASAIEKLIAERDNAVHTTGFLLDVIKDVKEDMVPWDWLLGYQTDENIHGNIQWLQSARKKWEAEIKNRMENCC